jgi:hypothetical protein
MRPALTRLTAVAALAGLGLLAGCGGGSSNAIPKNATPQTEFLAALQNTSHTDVLTSTLKIDATPEQLLAFAKATTAKGDSAPTPKQAQEITAGKLVIETKSSDGKQLTSVVPGGGAHIDTSIAFVEDNATDAEIRVVDSTIYLRGDLKALIALGGKPAIYDNLVAEVSKMPAFVRDFIAGKFVSIDTATLKTLAAEVGGAAGVSTPTSQQFQDFAATLKADINRDVTVTKVGSDDKGDHLVLKAQSQTLVKDLLTSVAKVEPQLATKIQADANAGKVPERTVTLDAYVKDGSVSGLSLDLAQFADPGQVPATTHIPLTMTFEQSGDDIAKPANATPVDVSQLFSILSSLGGK